MIQWQGAGACVLLACLGGLSACQAGDSSAATAQTGTPMASPETHPSHARGKAAEKSGTGQMRTDAEPLLKRFPLLGRPLATQWMSGTLGDARVPGPSTYWIDAIVDLPADHAAWLRQTYGLSTASAQPHTPAPAPEVTAGLLPVLGPGPWQGSRELDAAFSQQGFVARAYLQGHRLVLVAVGQ